MAETETGPYLSRLAGDAEWICQKCGMVSVFYTVSKLSATLTPRERMKLRGRRCTCNHSYLVVDTPMEAYGSPRIPIPLSEHPECWPVLNSSREPLNG